MFSKLLIFTVLLTTTATVVIVRADERPDGQADGRADATGSSAYSKQTVAHLKTDLVKELEQKYRQFNHPRIELGVIRLLSGKLPTQIKTVSLLSENDRGEAQFNVSGPSEGEFAQIISGYSAWVEVRVAAKRITPGERLSNDAFSIQEVNVATGMPYGLRGVLLSKTEDLSRLETRQTILEGQYLVSNAVQRVPDIRRGDSVRIRVISGDLNLSTVGVASEPGYSNAPIKVVTTTTHRELTGILQPGGIVEVKL